MVRNPLSVLFEVRFLKAANLRAASDHLVPNFQHGMDPDFTTQCARGRPSHATQGPTQSWHAQLAQRGPEVPHEPQGDLPEDRLRVEEQDVVLNRGAGGRRV